MAAKQPSYSIPLPDFTVTTAGVRTKMLVLESWKGDSALAVAVLAVRDSTTSSIIGLLLRRRRYKESKLKDPRYHIGLAVRGAHPWLRLPYRMAQVEWAAHALAFGDSEIAARWRRLYISHRAYSRRPAPSPSAAQAAFRFYFPRWLAVELAKVGFESDAPLPVSQGEARKLSDGGPLARFTFRHAATGEAFRIQLGQCGGAPWATASAVPAGPVESGLLTAQKTAPRPVTPRFECQKNTIGTWLNGSKKFGDSERSIQLTFTRMNEAATHLLDVRLGGRAYRRLNATGRRMIHTICRSLRW